ncbi:MAG: molybdopterin molybdenumtransferase MoeA [Anaerolineaceae bacterium]|nr:molybdopterin molybdenumtransferase MoeA [Anaerolineaceae bacterium]
MPEFLELLPPAQALERLLSQLPFSQPEIEEIETKHALGRVIARAVIAPERLPAFSRSTVDGYAVLARDTFGASDGLPAYLTLVGEVPMGAAPGFHLSPGRAAVIHTGGMLPEGANAVVMLEYTQTGSPGEVEVMRPAAPGENVLTAGEDVDVGQEVIPAGTKLTPAAIGGLMALGLTRVAVSRLPTVAILSSGDEVIDPSRSPQPGQVRDINSYTLAALVEESGGSPESFGILADRREVMQEALQRALSGCDIVVITAGSSASTRDLTAEVIASMGPPGVLVHGVNVKPGKPTILSVCGGKAVIGLPGNPVSALVIARLFLVPVIERCQGLPPVEKIPRALLARLAVNLASQAGREDWVPVMLVREASGRLRAEPIFYKSNLIFTLARADALLHIPADATGLEAGSDVEVELI